MTAGTTFLLILAGGLVTNTGAGLAVPDWPTTFGHPMFLYPWSKMVGGVLYEHSHRLIGSMVGLLTLALALVFWLVEPRRWLCWLGSLALGAVILQGILGGLRVVLLQDSLAILHGALAQAFFGLMASLVLLTSREWKVQATAIQGKAPGHLLGLSVLTTGGIFAQLVVGAFVTHLGARLDVHLLLAALIFLLVSGLSIRILTAHANRPELARPAVILCGLLILQLVLGLGSYLARFTSLELPLIPTVLGLALPVGHRLVGGLLFATGLVLTLRVHRLLGVSRPAECYGPVSGRATA